MDELWGALFIGGLIIVAIYTAIKFALIAFAWSFVSLSGFFGNPLLVIIALGAAGGAGGIIVLHRHQGPYVARSSHDYATIGNLKLTPEGWAALVISVFIASMALYGLLFVSSRAHQIVATARPSIPIAGSEDRYA